MIQKLYKFKTLTSNETQRMIRVKRHVELLEWVKVNCPDGWFKLECLKDGSYQRVSNVEGTKNWARVGGLIGVRSVDLFLQRKEYSMKVGKFYRFGSPDAMAAYSKSEENREMAKHIGMEKFEVLEVNSLDHITSIRFENGNMYSPRVPIIMPSEMRFFKEVFVIDAEVAKNAILLYTDKFGENVVKTDLKNILAYYHKQEEERNKLRKEKEKIEREHGELIRKKQELQSEMQKIDQQFISLNGQIAQITNKLARLK